MTCTEKILSGIAIFIVGFLAFQFGYRCSPAPVDKIKTGDRVEHVQTHKTGIVIHTFDSCGRMTGVNAAFPGTTVPTLEKRTVLR